jgi:hypothetical protein
MCKNQISLSEIIKNDVSFEFQLYDNNGDLLMNIHTVDNRPGCISPDAELDVAVYIFSSISWVI